MSSTGFIFSGDLFMSRLTEAGAFTGFIDKMSAQKLEITMPAEMKNRKSKMNASWGQSKGGVALPSETEIAYTIDEYDQNILASYWMGTSNDLDIAATPVAAGALTAKLDFWMPIDFTNSQFDLTSVVVTGPSQTPEYVLTTDYLLDATNGMIKALSTGSITEGELLEVDYTPTAKTGYRIEAGSSTIVRQYLFLDGINKEDGGRGKLYIPDCMVKPNAGFDFYSEDHIQAEFSGTVSIPTGWTVPFKFDYLDA